MDNEKGLKRTALDDKEIEAASGGKFSNEDRERIRRHLRLMIGEEEAYQTGLCIFGDMDRDPYKTYTFEDWLAKVEEEC